jgi:hypothetical protein
MCREKGAGPRSFAMNEVPESRLAAVHGGSRRLIVGERHNEFESAPATIP